MDPTMAAALAALQKAPERAVITPNAISARIRNIPHAMSTVYTEEWGLRADGSCYAVVKVKLGNQEVELEIDPRELVVLS